MSLGRIPLGHVIRLPSGGVLSAVTSSSGGTYTIVRGIALAPFLNMAPTTSAQPFSTAFAFAAMILGGLGLAGGLIMLGVALVGPGTPRESLWLLIAFTALSALIFVFAIGHLRGREMVSDRVLAGTVILAAVLLGALWFRTV